MTQSLINKKCVPCEGGVLPLTPTEIEKYQAELASPWSVLANKKISRQFEFKNFSQAIKFVNQVAAIAEAEGHHPDILLHDFKKVDIMLWTHAIGGLSENDFIEAAKIEQLVR